jgi:hypothetical protein
MYIDPANPSFQRFWNGSAWTDHVMPLNPATNDTVPMYLPPPSNSMPPSGPPTTPSPQPPPPMMPPPAMAPVYGYAHVGAGTPMHLRPFSQAAVWSIVLALFCPLIGIVFGIVGVTATGPSGDRRGRGAAVTGIVLCVLSMLFGALIFSSSSSGSQF